MESELLLIFAAIWILFCSIVLPILTFFNLRRISNLEKELHARTSHLERALRGYLSQQPPDPAHVSPTNTLQPQAMDVSATVSPPFIPQPPTSPALSRSPLPRHSQATASLAHTVESTATVPSPAEKASAKTPQKDLDVLWIARGAPILGGLFAIACLVFFGIHFFQNVSPWIRILQMVGACALCYGAGIWVLHKKMPLGQVLQGIGLAGFYLTTVAAYAVQPVKIVDSIWLAVALQIFSLGLILFDSLWRNREFMATCSMAFGFFSASLLYFENIHVGILPAALSLSIVALLLWRWKRWFSPLVVPLFLVTLLYGWFSSAEWQIPPLHKSIQVLGFPILLGIAGIAILHRLHEEKDFHIRIIILLWSVLFGGLMNYLNPLPLGNVYTMDWFTWIVVPLLVLWGSWEFHQQRRSQAGISLLLSTLLTLVWLTENSAFLTIALAAVLLIVQRKVSRGLLVQTSFLVALAGATGNLLNESLHLPELLQKYQITSLTDTALRGWNWLAVVFILLWGALAAILLYSRLPIERHKTLQKVFQTWIVLFGMSGTWMSILILPNNILSAVLCMTLIVYGLSWKSPQPGHLAQHTLLISAAFTLLIPPNSILSIVPSPLFIGSLFLASLWASFTVYTRERALYAPVALIATMILLPASEITFSVLGNYSVPWVLFLLLILYTTVCAFHYYFHKGTPIDPLWGLIPVLCILHIVTRALPADYIFSTASNSFWIQGNPLILLTVSIPLLLLTAGWFLYSLHSQYVRPYPKRNLLPLVTGGAITSWLFSCALYYEQAVSNGWGFNNTHPSPVFILLLPQFALLLLQRGKPLIECAWITVFTILCSFYFLAQLLPFESFVLSVCTLGLAILALRDQHLSTEHKQYLNWIFGGLSVIQILSIPVLHHDFRWVSTCLAVVSATLLTLGLIRDLKAWRILGLCLFPVVVAWILVIDLNNTFHRILAFGGLAILCLLVGFFYQKNRQREPGSE